MDRRWFAFWMVAGLLVLPMRGQADANAGFGSTCSMHVVHTPCRFTKRADTWVWVNCDPYWQLGCVPGAGECFQAQHYPVDTITVHCREFIHECPPNSVGGLPFDILVEKSWCDLVEGPLG